MSTTLNPVITDAGLNAAINAANNGLQLAITHVALGTGRYDATALAPGMTAMAGRVEQITLGAGTVSGTGAFQMAFRFDGFPGAPYDATEMGFWAGDPASGGILFAVHSDPVAVLLERNSLDYVASVVMQLTRVPAGSVTIEINPDEAQFLALLNLHVNDIDPHPVYLKKSGDTATGALYGLKPSRHNDSKLFVTSDWVQENGVRLSSLGGVGIATPSFNLTAAHMGRMIDIKDGSGGMTLPPLSSVPTGGTFMFRCSVETAYIFAGADELINTTTPKGAYNRIQITFGESLAITRNGNEWFVVSAGSRQPTGMVAFFIGVNAPPGWLLLNGVLISRAAYPTLYSYAQNYDGMVPEYHWWNFNHGRFSSGTTGANFRLPDLRGEFLRVYDAGRGIDLGREPGHFQWDMYASHAHASNGSPGSGQGASGGNFVQQSAGQTLTTSSGGAETRPRNVALNLYIKY